MFFSVIIKNLNWEILTKNLFTFKRWDGVKHEKLRGGGSHELKRGLGQFADLRVLGEWDLAEKKG